MLVAVVLIIELMAMFLCVHRLYGQKLKVDFASIVTFMTMLIVMYAVNFFELSALIGLISYIVLFVYCLYRYSERILPTIVSVLLDIILIALIEFFVVLISVFIPFKNMGIRDVLCAVLTLLIVALIMQHLKIDKLRTAICRRHWLMYIILFFVTIVVFLILVLVKTQESVQLGFFLFGVPAIAIILFLVVYWDNSVAEQKQMQIELIAMESMQNNYDDLLIKVKENQHGLKNHMMAVMSSHYTYKTYEQLVEAQQEYCGKIQDENKYNNLLLIGNHTLGGFLYGKIQEIESTGIKITYKIETKVESCYMPQYYIVEILGILLDNATEAVHNKLYEGAIHIDISKENESYRFIIRNTFPEIGYKEIAEWFELGKTTKGEGRGIGLCQVKKLCDEWNGNVICKNEKIDEQNWIVFEVWIKEKGTV